MTPEEAIKIIESLKDLINDNGKRELSVVQAAIAAWQNTEPMAPPSPEPEKAKKEKVTLAEEPEPKVISRTPWREESRRKTKKKK